MRAALRPLPSLPQWPGKRGGSGSGGLPTFSVEPLPYVTHVGDYLMMLPQQLELLFADELLGGTMTQVRGPGLLGERCAHARVLHQRRGSVVGMRRRGGLLVVQ